MNKKELGLMVLTITISFQSLCQVRLNDIKLAVQYVPTSRYILPFNGVSRIKTNSTTTQIRYGTVLNFDLKTNIDTVKKSVKLWSATVVTDYLTMSNKEYEREIFPESLVASSVSIQHYRSLKNKWGFLALLSVGVNSDLKKVNGNDIFANVGGLFIKNYNRNFSLGFGLFINNNFGKPLPWPAITTNWQLGSKYKLKVNVPDAAPGLAYNISFARIFNERTDLSIFFRPGVISYDVENSVDNKRLLNNWQIPIGLENQWHTKRIDFFVNGGLMALRSFDYAEKDLAKMFAKNPYHHLSANFFLSVGFKFKMPN
ncbi:MAG: hypothetical protein EBR30_12760 [Cytophagia bacterium]|nr:hypothetical protein [Cytophagia bacterium]